MERMEIEVYSQQTNAAVMKAPGRQFPGVLIQGDRQLGAHLANDS